MDPLTRLVHVLALAVYLGSTVALVLVLLPAASAVEDPALRRRVLARGLKPYNVLSVGALGVLILTGASSLTDWKRALGPAYGRVLWPLVGKLSLTFALTMVGTWLSFGIAHRLVRAELGGLPVEPEREQSMMKRLAAGGWLAIALAVWTTWAGLSLATAGAGGLR
jgi:uncharacterized membrane protein